MTNNVYADEADRLYGKPDPKQPLLDLVAGMELEALEKWLEKQVASPRLAKRRFIAEDECGCPLAIWLADQAGQSLYVSDDCVTDSDLRSLGDLPTWAARFVHDFDMEYGAVKDGEVSNLYVAPADVLEFVRRKKSAWGDRDGE